MGPKAPKNQNMQPCLGLSAFFTPSTIMHVPHIFPPLVLVPQLSLSLSLTPWVHSITPMSLTPPGCAGELDPGQPHGGVDNLQPHGAPSVGREASRQRPLDGPQEKVAGKEVGAECQGQGLRRPIWKGEAVSAIPI